MQHNLDERVRHVLASFRPLQQLQQEVKRLNERLEELEKRLKGGPPNGGGGGALPARCLSRACESQATASRRSAKGNSAGFGVFDPAGPPDKAPDDLFTSRYFQGREGPVLRG